MNNTTSKAALPRDSGMSDTRIEFYQNTIAKWIENKAVSILVVRDGETDRSVFYAFAFLTKKPKTPEDIYSLLK